MSMLFLSEYIKNFREVGAVAPSSRFLADKMLASIDFDKAKVIVEYGPGTGVFTSALKKRMSPDTVLIVIENNIRFYDMLRDDYAGVSNIEIVSDSAENIESVLASFRISSPDYVISGLPFAALPVETSQNILESTKRILGTKGTFITFQYTLLKRGLLGAYFSDIQLTREIRNIPPAYVLRCQNIPEAN